MRVVEATAAGLIVGLVVAVIAAQVGTSPLFAGPLAFLIGFTAWASTGRTVARYGTRRRRRR